MSDDLSHLALALVKTHQTMVTVESCTGGLLGSMLTSHSGASKWYYGGWITYSNLSKSTWLRIAKEQIDAHGSVSLPVTDALAIQALEHCPSDFVLAITGYAEMDECHSDQAGRIYVVARHRSGHSRSYCYQLNGLRTEIQQQACLHALRDFINFVQYIAHLNETPS